MAGHEDRLDSEAAALMAQVERRMAGSPGFRDRLRRLVERDRVSGGAPSWTAGLDYLDATLESPRLRALLDEPKRRAAARRADAD